MEIKPRIADQNSRILNTNAGRTKYVKILKESEKALEKNCFVLFFFF